MLLNGNNDDWNNEFAAPSSPSAQERLCSHRVSWKSRSVSMGARLAVMTPRGKSRPLLQRVKCQFNAHIYVLYPTQRGHHVQKAADPN
jgi:hypothetical protein